MKKVLAVLAIFAVAMAVVPGQVFAGPAEAATSGRTCCVLPTGEVEIRVPVVEVSSVMGSATPLFGAEQQLPRWASNAPGVRSGDVWVAKIKVCSGFKPGDKLEWGFWAGPDLPWGPGVLFKKGLVPLTDLKDNTYGTYNFVTTCR